LGRPLDLTPLLLNRRKSFVGPAQTQQQTPGNQQVAVNDTPVTPTTGPSTQLEQIANSLNEPLVPVGQTSMGRSRTTRSSSRLGAKQYKAQAGDSLSKIAARFLRDGQQADDAAASRCESVAEAESEP
jgi:hypothetical protein